MERGKIFEIGWRRHSIISNYKNGIKTLKEYLPAPYKDLCSDPNCLAILSTYDCAVVHDSLEAEPWLQLLIANPTPTLLPQFVKCNNPRVLHFTVEKDGNAVNYQITAAGICQVERKILLSTEPCPKHLLNAENKLILKTWLAERYRQETWPDVFNQALKPAQNRLKRLWKRYNNYISGYYIRLNTYDELEEGEKYIAEIIVAVETNKYRSLITEVRSKNNDLKNATLDEVLAKIENEVFIAFGEAIQFREDRTKVNNKAIEVLEETQITIDMLRDFYRYSPFAISINNEDAPTPQEILGNKTES